MSGGYEIPVGGGFSVTTSVFYSGQSGRPWSANYRFDYNGDVRPTNDLLYIPARADEVSFMNGTFDDLMAFVNAEKCLSDYIGQIHERNTCRAPWINTLDFRVNVGLPFRRVKAEITWDVLNVINLLDRQNGLLEYANFNDLLVVRPVISSTGAITYNLQDLFLAGVRQTPRQQFTRNDLLSRWQMQLGGRIRF
jgi:hypothetical protein